MKQIYLFFLLFFISNLHANEADVIKVKATCSEYKVCTFFVTIRHQDSSWKHYVNKYEILTPKGEIITTRILHHPHVDEQPFTRSISNVKIPKDINSVTIRAHDLVHQYGGKEVTIEVD